MPDSTSTNIGILILMCWIKFVEHENEFITSEPGVEWGKVRLSRIP